MPIPGLTIQEPPLRARQIGICATLLVVLLLCACASPWTTSIRPGDTADDLRQRIGPPTAEHVLPNGERRLEYWSGSFGLNTMMVDIDAQGFILGSENVRDEAHFNRIQPGINRDQLRQQLGTPSKVWRVRYRDQTVWSYKFWGPFCLIFHVGINPRGIVEDTSYGPDPACDGPLDRPGVR